MTEPYNYRFNWKKFITILSSIVCFLLAFLLYIYLLNYIPPLYGALMTVILLAACIAALFSIDRA